MPTKKSPKKHSDLKPFKLPLYIAWSSGANAAKFKTSGWIIRSGPNATPIAFFEERLGDKASPQRDDALLLCSAYNTFRHTFQNNATKMAEDSVLNDLVKALGMFVATFRLHTPKSVKETKNREFALKLYERLKLNNADKI